MKRKFWSSQALVLGLTCFLTSQAYAVPVGLELALLVDVSGSVDNSEYNLQKQGYINTFKNAGFASLLPANGIAVTYIEWSGASQQSQLVNWTQITDATSASNFADTIAATSRAFSGSTAPGSAINFAVPLFSNNGFEGDRLVIDVSGDGQQNSGADTASARDAAINAGIDAINGLPIGGLSLQNWYQNNVVGGTNAFLEVANNFSDFGTAVQRKIGREVGGGGGGTVPEPATLLLFGIGLAGMRLKKSFA